MRRAILLLNGPPGCGKDTIGNIIVSRARELFNVRAEKFSEPLKLGGLGLVGEVPTLERAEVLKELTLRETVGIDSDERHRDFWIWLSEEVLKPKYGQDYFGKILASKIRRSDARLVVITDSGFEFEADAVAKVFGYENLYQIKIRREGKTFEETHVLTGTMIRS